MEIDFDYIVEMRDIYKYFGNVLALDCINFSVGRNEVVGLIGDNGAGKSTLIKILTGVYPPSKGEIYIKGRRVYPDGYSVKKSHNMKIETVYQEKALGRKQALWRNFFIGRQITNKLGFINIAKEKEEAKFIMEKLIGFRGVGISANSTISKLSGGESQGIAIGRAMYFNSDLIILDEPTVALSINESKKVNDFIKKIKMDGKSCIIISHNIYEIYSVSDRIVFIDMGKIVAQYKRDETSVEELTDKFLEFCK
jgi:simple sugar transport system ATP-binding protein